jgi:hypothetical protein
LKRGGWQYFQPVNSQRYGINVSQKYDRKSDIWLSMNGQDGEWAVAFHGVKKIKNQFIKEEVQTNNNPINSIFLGR